MTPRKFKADEPVISHATKYRVSWWTRHPETGDPVFNHLDYDDIGAARRSFKGLPESAEPAAFRVDWSEATRSWHATDLIGRGRTPEEARADRVRGLEMLRAVSAHHRGADTRGRKPMGEPLNLGALLADMTNVRGHDHRNGAEGCPVCTRAVSEAKFSSECPSCDYLADHGRQPQHPGAGLVQGTLGEQVDERF